LASLPIKRNTSKNDFKITKFVHLTTGVLLQQNRLVAGARPNLIAAWFVVDASGSMAGGRWNRAQQGIRTCLAQLADHDFVGLITFNNSVNVVDVNMKKDLKTNAFFRMSPGGGTALYDGIAQMVIASTKMHLDLTQASQGRGLGVITYVVVLTDGEDTTSKLDLAQTRTLLSQVNKLRNFKIIFAGISLDWKTSQILRSLGSSGDSDIEFRELKSNDDINDLFEHITIQLALQRTNTLIVGNQNSRVITTSSNYQPIGYSGSGSGSGYSNYNQGSNYVRMDPKPQSSCCCIIL